MAYKVTPNDIDELTLNYVSMSRVNYAIDHPAYDEDDLVVRHIIAEQKFIPESDVANYSGSYYPYGSDEPLTAPWDYSGLSLLDGNVGVRLRGSLLELSHRPFVTEWSLEPLPDNMVERIRDYVGLVDSLFVVESIEVTEHFTDEDASMLLHDAIEIFPMADALVPKSLSKRIADYMPANTNDHDGILHYIPSGHATSFLAV